MQFKELSLKIQYKNSSAMLKMIAMDFEKISMHWGIEPVITRITDPVENESGVHVQKRAIDIRNEYMKQRIYNIEQVNALVNFINATYPRLDKYKTILHHRVDGSVWHFHIQIPYNSTDVLLKKEF